MRFSRRASWDLGPNALSRLLGEKQAAGARIVDLTESNPTRAGIAYPEAEVLGALAAAEALAYAPSPRGLEAAREAVAAYYARRGYPVDPGRILLTASTSEAYAFAFKLLCDPGDEVLVPAPSYPLFEFLATLESVRVRSYPLVYHGGWEIDLGALRAAVGPAVRAIVLVSPNNPTGSFLKRGELDALRALCAQGDLALVADEVFGDYAFAPDGARADTLVREEGALCFTLSGLSKVAGLPQVKLGWMVVSGPGSDAALDRLDIIADTYLSVSTPAQLAGPALLEIAPRVAGAIRDRVRGNLQRLRDLLGRTSPLTLLAVEGGWYATLRFPRTRTEEEWVLGLLGEKDVLVHPGQFFDFPDEAYGVLSLLTRPEAFAEGVARLVSFVG
jgi:hypothetical protein